MAKYNAKKIEECETWIATHGLVDYGGKKLYEYCQEMGIDNKTHYHWLQKKEYREAVERGKETFKSQLAHDLSISLAEAAKGGKYEKKKEHKEYRPTENGQQGRLVKIVVDTESGYTPPNVGAAIFLLTNLDPEHYQNRQRSDITLKKDEEQPMTIDEINAEIARLEKLEK